MSAPESFLDRIDVASPCSASWDAMQGDDRSRFCGDCKLSVYNLSAMTRAEAEGLLQGASGRICTRFLRRADGTVITQDCGPIRRAIQRRLRMLRVAASALFGFLAAFATAGCGDAPARAKETQVPVQKPEPEPLMGEAVVVEELMGDVCMPEEMLGRVAPPIQKPPAPKDSPAPKKD